MRRRADMDGTFEEDLQRLVDMWTDHPGCPPTWWERVRLIWTHQSLQATAILRLANWCKRRRIPMLPGIFGRLNTVLFGLDVVVGLPIGGGLHLPHTVGTVVMAARIGRNVTLVSNVTIGMRNERRFPVIGDNVYVGAGARILGPVTIGEGAIIGANAVVITDIPAGATAVGVPARIIQRQGTAGGVTMGAP